MSSVSGEIERFQAGDPDATVVRYREYGGAVHTVRDLDRP